MADVKDLAFWQMAAMGQFIKSVCWGKAEEWETLFEEEVTTKKGVYNDLYSETYRNNFEIVSGDMLRLTIDGQTKVYTAYTSGNATVAGNVFLTDPDLSTDDGFGLALEYFVSVLPTQNIFTRAAGTYNVKIERAVS